MVQIQVLKYMYKGIYRYLQIVELLGRVLKRFRRGTQETKIVHLRRGISLFGSITYITNMTLITFSTTDVASVFSDPSRT